MRRGPRFRPRARRWSRDHLKDLEMNRYPQISKKLGRPIDDIKAAVKRLGRLHPHPGKQIGGERCAADHARRDHLLRRGHRQVRNRDDQRPGAEPLHQRHVAQDAQGKAGATRRPASSSTNNVRNARWLIESIEQRKSTIKRVIRAVVDAQQRVLRKGPGAPQAAADDPGRRPARHPRRHRLPRRQRKVDPDPRAASSRCGASSPAARPTPKAKT